MLYPHLPAIGSLSAPDLLFEPSPNRSSRNGRAPRLLFNHVWGGGSFDGVVEWLRSDNRPMPERSSAHVVYAGELGPDKGKAVQLVPWSEKAWTECDLNPIGWSLEVADAIWRGHDPEGFARLARMNALILHIHGIPPRWVRGSAVLTGGHGHCRHADAGTLGCGHLVCPTHDLALYGQFAERVTAECRHGGFRDEYGRKT